MQRTENNFINYINLTIFRTTFLLGGGGGGEKEKKKPPPHTKN